jgi:hypothetical protein
MFQSKPRNPNAPRTGKSTGLIGGACKKHPTPNQRIGFTNRCILFTPMRLDGPRAASRKIPGPFPTWDSGPGCSARKSLRGDFRGRQGQKMASSFTPARFGLRRSENPSASREPCITVPRSQSHQPQPLDLLDRAGLIASDAERQPEIKSAVSRNQDQNIARDSAESRNTPGIQAPMVDDDALDHIV